MTRTDWFYAVYEAGWMAIIFLATIGILKGSRLERFPRIDAALDVMVLIFCMGMLSMILSGMNFSTGLANVIVVFFLIRAVVHCESVPSIESLALWRPLRYARGVKMTLGEAVGGGISAALVLLAVIVFIAATQAR